MIHRCIGANLFSKTPTNGNFRCWRRYVDSHRKKSNSSMVDKRDGDPADWPTGSKPVHAFHPEIEAIFNRQVNAEFSAFYCYLSMASYFGRVDVAMPGCESYFTQMHAEEHEHALRCVNYVKMRGGTVDLCAIAPPNDQDWKCPLNAFKMALQLEMDVTDKLVGVNAVATKHGDLDASDFVVTNLLNDQSKSVNEIAKFITVLSGIGDRALARFVFDKDLMENHVLPEFKVSGDKGTPSLKK